MEFIINYWYIFVIVAVVLLLGLFGYMMDRKKYDEYREEIINEGRASNTLASSANVSEVANIVKVEETNAGEENNQINA